MSAKHSPAELQASLLKRRIKVFVTLNLRLLWHALAVACLALPLTMLRGEGPVLAAGIAYLLLYVGAMAAPTTLSLMFAADGIALFHGATPRLVPWIMQALPTEAFQPATAPRRSWIATTLAAGTPAIVLVFLAFQLASMFRDRATMSYLTEITQKVKARRTAAADAAVLSPPAQALVGARWERRLFPGIMKELGIMTRRALVVSRVGRAAA